MTVLLAQGASRIPFPSAARRARWRELLLNPVGISWMAAAAAGFGLLLAISPWSSDPVAPPKTSQPANETDPKSSVAEKTDKTTPQPVEEKRQASLPAKPPEIPESPPVIVEEPPRPPMVPRIAAAVPGEGDRIAKPADAKHPGELPPVAPPEPPQTIEIVRALQQPILRFEQTPAIPAREALRLIEEMIAVPIRIDRQRLGEAAKQLDRPISVVLDDTTIREILDAIVENAGLTYEILPDGISVRAAPASAMLAPRTNR